MSRRCELFKVVPGSSGIVQELYTGPSFTFSALFLDKEGPRSTYFRRRDFRVSSLHGKAFTLIEVLVVVAIIALLLAILIPSLAKAREMSRRAVCLSNLHQQGVGMGMYTSDSRGYFPKRSDFGYYIKLNNKPANYGILYGKYVGKDINIFYCPGHLPAAQSKDNWKEYGSHTFLMPDKPNTFGGYMYAAPANDDTYPKNAGKDTYTPKGVKDDVPVGIWHSNFRLWLRYTKGYNGSPGSKNYYTEYQMPPIQAIQVDQIIGGPETGWTRSLHGNGLNALYNDLHARFVQDDNTGLLRKDATSGTGGAHQLYNMWEYIGRHY